MNKLLATIVAVSASAMAIAADANAVSANTDGMSLEERKEIFLKKTGGLVRHEAEGPNIVVVDGRRTPGKVLKYFEKENVKAHGSAPGLPVKTYSETVENDPIAKAGEILASEKAAMAIVIANCGANAPGLAICPEDRVAAINADRYGDKDFLLLKEIWRTIGFIGGVGYTKYSSDPMQPVYSVEELEAMPGTALLPASLNALRTFNTRFGIKPAFSLPYIAAVRQGWAPAPTNDIQKAIWGKVHAMPTEPLKIKPETKKQEK